MNNASMSWGEGQIGAISNCSYLICEEAEKKTDYKKRCDEWVARFRKRRHK